MNHVLGRPTRIEVSAVLLALALGSVFPVLVMVDSGFYFRLNQEPYTALHSLLEMASILVGFAVFIVNWEASKLNRNSQSLFIAVGFLAVTIGDVLHALSFRGMPAFVTPNDAEKSIYFWLFARVWAGVVLLVAAFIPTTTKIWALNRYLLATVTLLACAAMFVVVAYYPSNLPTVIVEGSGITMSKIVTTYSVVALNLVAAAVYARIHRKTGDRAQIVLALALVLSVFSEVYLTMYRYPTDVYTLLGHGYKVVAYYLIFRALLVSSVERPYVQLQQTNEELGRAVAQLNERTQELDALDEIALTLSSSLKPDELLASAIDKVIAVMQAEAGAIFLVSEDGDELRIAAWRGLRAATIAQFRAHPGLIRNIAATRPASVISVGTGESLEEPGPGAAAAHIAPLRKCVCAPVTTKGRLLGAISMAARDDRAFGPSDADLLTAVGYQLGLAIENARLYGRTDETLREKLQELRQAERKSRFLAEAAALLASSMDLGKVLGLVARKASEVVGDWCAVYLADERSKALKLAAVYHSDLDELGQVRTILARGVLLPGQGLVGLVAQSGQPILVAGETVQRLSMELESLAVTAEELAVVHRLLPSSAIIAPMRARGITIGVLLVTEMHSSEPLADSDLALVTELGDRAGVAIQNSQLLEESQEQRRHLEAIISQMVDGLVIADADGQVVLANSAAQAMLRGQVGAIIGDGEGGRRPQDANGSTAESVPLVRRAMEGAPLLGEEVLVRGEFGERVLSASATAVRDDQGEVTGAVVVLRDVTAEREVERMKDEFVATVSHELRTPITAVLGYTDLLLRGMRGPMAPAQSDALSSIRNAGRRLLTLIEDLLDISKLEAGTQDLYVDVVSVAAAVDRAMFAVSVGASNKRVRLVQEIPPGLPPVLADDSQLQRILGNLLSNALKFTPEGGTVTVSAEARPGDGHGADSPRYVAIQVSDTGVGIPADKQKSIWEKFQQVDSSSSRMFGGTGLGLAIVKGLVELHGGTVWVSSEGIPGQGSAFGFTLPAADISAGTSGVDLAERRGQGEGN